MNRLELEIFLHPVGGFGYFAHGIESGDIEMTQGGFQTQQEAIRFGHQFAQENDFEVVNVIKYE